MTRSVTPESSAVVVAHPDDEILWFASMLPQVNRIVICYGDNAKVPNRGDQRRRVVERYPLPGVRFLDLPEPVAAGTGPKPFIGGRGNGNGHSGTGHELIDRLREQLIGICTIFTHNPWGEYGHRHHRAVYAAVESLAAELGAEIFVSGYVSVGSLAPCSEVLSRGVIGELRGQVDPKFTRDILSLYVQGGCWTWRRDWIWPEYESFYRLGMAEFGRNRTLPLQVILPPWQMNNDGR